MISKGTAFYGNLSRQVWVSFRLKIAVPRFAALCQQFQDSPKIARSSPQAKARFAELLIYSSSAFLFPPLTQIPLSGQPPLRLDPNAQHPAAISALGSGWCQKQSINNGLRRRAKPFRGGQIYALVGQP